MTTDVIARLRLMHKPRTERPGSCCIQCGIVWPCPTSKVLDEVDAVPADADLRDRIRRAICEANGFDWDAEGLEPDEYGDHADAVLAVHPAPADRYRLAWQSARGRAQAYGEGILRVVEDRESYQGWLKEAEGQIAVLLRRLADEAQQPEGVSEVARLRAALERGRRVALTFEVSGNEFIADQIRTALDVDEPADQGQAEGAQR